MEVGRNLRLVAIPLLVITTLFFVIFGFLCRLLLLLLVLACIFAKWLLKNLQNFLVCDLFIGLVRSNVPRWRRSQSCEAVLGDRCEQSAVELASGECGFIHNVSFGALKRKQKLCAETARNGAKNLHTNSGEEPADGLAVFVAYNFVLA